MKALKKGFDPSPSRIWYNKKKIGYFLDMAVAIEKRKLAELKYWL